MLFHLLPQFADVSYLGVLNVTRYITFRTAAASLTALAISLMLGPWMIRKLRDFQVGQVIRQEGPESHRAKAGTPTMGGLLILSSALVPTLLWADLQNPYVWIAVLSTLGFGAVGTRHELAQPLGNDLPRQPPAVLQPAALLRRAVLLERIPEPVDLRLRLAFDDDGEAVVERVEGPGLDGHVALIAEREGGDLDTAGGSARGVAC